MSGTRWRKVRADLLTHPLRSLLAIVSLAVGTSAVGTMVLAGATVASSFESGFQAANPPSAMLTTDAFSPELTEMVANHPNVDQVEGRRLHRAQVTGTDGGAITVELVSMVDFAANQVALIDSRVGSWPPAPGQIVFEQATMGEITAEVGSTVTIEGNDDARLDFEVAGVAHDAFEVAPMLGGVPRAYIAMESLIGLTGTDHLNALYLRAAGDATSSARASDMTAAVRNDVLTPAGVAVLTNAVDDPGVHRAEEAVTFLTLAMQILSIFALVIAVALVVNTVAAVLAQQRRHIGVMKAIGATTRQLTVQYLAYVSLLSVGALVLAVPAALVAGRAVAGFLADLANVQLAPLGFPVGVILLQAAIALLLPVGAVLLVVRRASRTTVREAITDVGITATARVHHQNTTLGRPTVLAYRNAARNRLRLGLTVLSISLCGAVLVGVISTGGGLTDLSDEVAGYSDFDVALSLTEPVPTAVVTDALTGATGVTAVEGWLSKQGFRVRPDDTESTNIDLTAVPHGSTAITPTLLEGRWFAAEDGHGIVINADLASEEPDLTVGESITLEVEGHRQEWRIVGIASTTTVGPVAYLPVERLAEATGQAGHTNLATVQLAPGGDAATTAVTLGTLAREAGLPLGQVQTHAEIRESIDGLFAIVVALLLMVGVVLAIVAVVGVAGTMTLSVVEQTREIGVLRTLGATTWSVRRLLLIQGLAIAGVGAVLGVALSIPVAATLTAAIRNNLISAPLPVTFSWAGVGIWLVVAITIGAIGATQPARLAARLTIRDTLAYE